MSNSTNDTRHDGGRRRMNFRERMAWLGRMPGHYKILFGSQLLITLFAIRMRYKLVERQKERDEKITTSSSTSSSTAVTTPIIVDKEDRR